MKLKNKETPLCLVKWARRATVTVQMGVVYMIKQPCHVINNFQRAGRSVVKISAMFAAASRLMELSASPGPNGEGEGKPPPPAAGRQGFVWRRYSSKS